MLRRPYDAGGRGGPFHKLTAVAFANKLARIVYALATKDGHYEDRPVAA